MKLTVINFSLIYKRGSIKLASGDSHLDFAVRHLPRST